MNTLDPQIQVETPEQIAFSYSVAGIGSRTVAAFVDYSIIILLLIGLAVLSSTVLGPLGNVQKLVSSDSFSSTSWALAILGLLQFILTWGYYVISEWIGDGQTIGKRIVKLRVVQDGGYSITFRESAIRNLVRLLDIQPLPLPLVGVTSILLNKSGKRLGDLAAGTFVIKESAVVVLPVLSTATSTPRQVGLVQAQLTDAEYSVLERYVTRRQSLEPERRQVFAKQLIKRFSPVLTPAEIEQPAATLIRLFERERDARATGVAARSDTGAQREQHSLVALGVHKWNSFAQSLAAAKRQGLSKMSAEDVSTFVAQYREVATDLAQLQTATRGRQSDALFYLSRLVAGGHNLLYRKRKQSFAAFVRYITFDVPIEIRRSWLPIMIAASLLFIPLTTAYVTVARTPSIAPQVLPEEMLHRARTAAEREQRGEGYVTINKGEQPIAASDIMTNNIQVTYLVFALGLTAGIMTVFILLNNGVAIGSVLGLYHANDVSRLLFGFIVPHGVLELTAICIAGGGGFLLASALLLPGNRTRREALVQNGKRAITLIAGSSILLIVAGAIEGLISPRVWPLEWKVAVSAATAIVLIGYLSLGDARKSQA